MRAIEVSEDVWREIAARGKFGECEDDVLRRVFKLPPNLTGIAPETMPLRARSKAPSRRPSMATRTLSCSVSANQLHSSFYDGPSRAWTLPDRSDKAGIRKVRDEAVAFARENGATLGQINAVKKALTDSGFHVIK